MADKALYRESNGLLDRERIQYDALQVVTAEPVEPKPVHPYFVSLNRSSTTRTDESDPVVNLESEGCRP